MWYKGGVPRIGTAQKIAANSGCRVEWLLYGEGRCRTSARRRTMPDAGGLPALSPLADADEHEVPAGVQEEFCFIPRYNLKASAALEPARPASSRCSTWPSAAIG
ncbi:Uncharacterised protein [Chromobacterium violaceum]|uniref:Uncharacterized protein n=1 Tax=Chromobacterium violaceum TaxID=536 RepID=A0A3S4LGA5_CHRVL|nr:Uncharacterised protein [Chromobacterium violaceum]